MISFNKKEAGFINQVEMKQTKAKLLYWFMFAFLLLSSAISVIPTLWIMISGFKDLEEFFAIPPTIIPKTFHPEKIVQVWKQFDFLLYYKNTVVVTLGVIVFNIVFNGLSGYVLSRLKPKGSKAVFMGLMFIMMIPNTVGMVPYYMTICDFPYFHFSLLNSFLALWIPAAANIFNILLFKNSFDSIPASYLEAARIDGAANLQIFYKIIIPLSVPIIMTVAILSFTSSWGDFFWPYLVLNDPQKYTISIFLFQNKTGNYTMDIYMIMLTLSILPPMIIYAFLQKYIMSGVAVGGIKG